MVSAFKNEDIMSFQDMAKRFFSVSLASGGRGLAKPSSLVVSIVKMKEFFMPERAVLVPS